MTVRTHAIVKITPTQKPQPSAKFSRAVVLWMLEAGRFQELYMLLLDQRRHHPHDMELMRSVRVLEWYFDKKTKQTAA